MSSDLLGLRLARTPYFVIPKLALKAMPEEWQERFEQLMKEADETGLSTPEYNVFRSIEGGEKTPFLGCRNVGSWGKPFYKLVGRGEDPWADYKYGDVKKLCPTFNRPE